MLLLAQKNYPGFFKSLHVIAVDEWHELLGSKRGVQVELAISRILAIGQPSTVNRQQPIGLWGISATIGNLDEAKEVLLSSLPFPQKEETVIVKAKMDKRIEVLSVLPDEIEKYP